MLSILLVQNNIKCLLYIFDEPKMGIKRLIDVNTIKNTHEWLKAESEKTLIFKFKLWKLLKK